MIPKATMIHWDDSAGCNTGWSHKSDADSFAQSGPMKCVSVGFVLHSPTKKEPWITLSRDYVLPSNYEGEHSHCGPMLTIPKSAIRKAGKL
jgi:hypothetical protein